MALNEISHMRDAIVAMYIISSFTQNVLFHLTVFSVKKKENNIFLIGNFISKSSQVLSQRGNPN
jgi:hypothetical protein